MLKVCRFKSHLFYLSPFWVVYSSIGLQETVRRRRILLYQDKFKDLISGKNSVMDKLWVILVKKKKKQQTKQQQQKPLQTESSRFPEM